MLDHFPFFLALIVLIVLLIMLGKRIRVAYPVLLVLAGLLISFMPGMPVLKIDPELIFILFLPPLLYEAAWANSWKELWRWRRVISSFAFIVVFLTAISVAVISNSFIPGFSLALGFLLGGIVSPPDAVSAGAILKLVKVPKRMTSILEGESLRQAVCRRADGADRLPLYVNNVFLNQFGGVRMSGIIDSEISTSPKLSISQLNISFV